MPRHCATLIAIPSALFLYFAFWAVVRPPYQSPDEFAHFYRLISLPDHPWTLPSRHIRVQERYMNPLTRQPSLRRVAQHPAEKLKREEILALRRLQQEPDSGRTRKVATNAWNYPALYYAAVFALARPLIAAAGLKPYEGFYVYRLASCLIAAIAWLLVYLALVRRFPESGKLLFVFTVANPMLAFISGSISPDSLLNPLAAYALIAFYGVLRGANAWPSFIALVALSLAKPAGLFLFMPLAVAAVLVPADRGAAAALLTRSRFRALLICGAALLSAILLFYLWLPPDAAPGAPSNRREYLYLLDMRLVWLFQSYWGIFGWFDHRLGGHYLVAMALVMLLNFAALVRSFSWPSGQFLFYLALVFVLFSAQLLLLEWYLLPVKGLLLQGRYFLPVSLAVASLFAAHRKRPLQAVALVLLVLMHVALFKTTVARYYGGDYALLRLALPFTPM